jgi:iron complex transport system ATP-binding protein
MLKALNIQVPDRLNIPSLELPLGKITMVLGSNGAGKSTLVGVLSGEIDLPGTEVFLDGAPLSELSYQDRAVKLAVLGQRQRLDFEFPAEDVIRMGADPLNLTEQQIADRVKAIAEALGIDHLLQRKYTTLSGGESQRIQLARVLMQRPLTPGVILLDEPLTALDLRHQVKTMNFLRHTLCIILHDPNIASQYGDHFLLITEGEVVAEGDHAILSEEALHKIYEIDVRVTSKTEQGYPQFTVGGTSP